MPITDHLVEDLEIHKFIRQNVKRDHIQTDLLRVAEHLCGVPKTVAEVILRRSDWELVDEQVAENYKSALASYRLGKPATPHEALQRIGTGSSSKFSIFWNVPESMFPRETTRRGRVVEMIMVSLKHHFAAALWPTSGTGLGLLRRIRRTQNI